MALASQLGKRILAIRTQAGKTQEEFAGTLRSRRGRRASAAQVSRWERGVAQPSRHYLEQLARIGGTTVEALLNGKRS